MSQKMSRLMVLAWFAFLAQVALAVPFGYRYIGSRVVSEGRHVYWYWNADVVEIGADGGTFIARMYARNLELDQERSYAAIIRCEPRSYRQLDSRQPFESIDDADPISAVWRAGCDGWRAVTLATRNARMNGAGPPKESVPGPAPVAAAAPATNVAAPQVKSAAPATGDNDADPRRVDRCIRVTEGNGNQFGDAQIANTCGFNVEVVLCYKGGRGGSYDCPAVPKATRSDSLAPGASRNLAEYRRGSNTGIVVVACKGTMETVFPMLDERQGKRGCF